MISIAMATYNGEKYLKAQIESILNQTVLPDEIVIRDDCSTDNTLKIVNEYERQNNTIRWDIRRNTQNVGYVKNFIGAMKDCHGDIIILCDQDDVWKRNKVEFIIRYFSDPGVKSLHGDYDLIDAKGNVFKKNVLGYKIEKEKVYLNDFFRYLYYCGMSSAFRRELMTDILTVDTDVLPTHDWLVHACAVMRGGFYKTSEILAYRRYHGDNVALNLGKTERRGIEQREEVVKYYCIHYKLLDQLYSIDKTQKKEQLCTARIVNTNNNRLEYLEKRSIGMAIGNAKNLKYYPTFKSYVSDLLYLVKELWVNK